ncbi:MAG: hypothetical protein AB2L07_18940 [Thermoanaerobaculaceae bacterium]
METGPVACSCPAGELHVLPPDLHVEVVRPDGGPAAPGERGEVTVSGGRNPLLPLLRYRTGDFARMACEPCGCGDPAPRLLGLAGREPVLFRADDGTPVGAVDISRAPARAADPAARVRATRGRGLRAARRAPPRRGAARARRPRAGAACYPRRTPLDHRPWRSVSTRSYRPSRASYRWSGDMDDPERDDDWQCEDDLGSLPGCLQTRKVERPVEAGVPTSGPARPER